MKIAFLADVHFQDLYGEFSDSNFKGIENPKTGKKTILRTMDSQLHSTRIFNENYFAFLAALDDIAKRNIKIVALPGDYTDDGQAYNLRGLKKVLEEYQKKYKMRFFITTGNHDPVGPFLKQGGKSDFMDENGVELSIVSNEKLIKNKDQRTVVTKDIAMSGYLEILNEMKNFGCAASEKDLFWQTPFSTVPYQQFNFKNALKDSKYSNRMYEVSPGFLVPDLSYVVEPIKGIWLMAIDGNTYIPKNSNGDLKDENNFQGASIGYNTILTNKKHLFSWVEKVVNEAKKHNKTLIAFTHYPILDFNDNAIEEIKKLLGKDKWQMDRVPQDEVAELLVKAGLKLHFAGHMHINDTGIKKFDDGKILVNIQVPSLAAYIPGYKILTVNSEDKFEVETVSIKNVPRFNELFPLYEKEFDNLKTKNLKEIWNKNILKTKNYQDFTLFHLKELVRLRFIPSDWPKDFIEKASKLSGKDLLELSSGNQKISNKIKNKFAKWNFEDALLNLYQLQSADELAKKDIPKKRLSQYKFLEQNFENLKTDDEFLNQLKTFFKILEKLSSGDASDHFKIDFQKGEIVNLK
ncbi:MULTISPECIES: metallophosphoesterase family protein [Chryseobacterium]|uniref:metallophosphoesterase family protein n=1 Tax=Chryseobacterium TaxID=59732 RepID=UPI001EF99FDA|nr:MULTISPECIES: metallophosphoesterase [Chryseobacterium]MBM7417528.1 putative MPP superfamily phosphohydrolase [Chryseobacterium sp. JUb44]MDH6211719.1 putative MPP superfamily phosphohydrolase [Chryseobacterium sp. BIGb0186]WSO10361.1 metallophosphoesterase [Chryseobacterium scophthalmum]